MPDRQKPQRSGVLEAERALVHPPFEEGSDFPTHLSDLRLRPPGDRQRKIMGRLVISTPEKAEDAIVERGDLPALPMALRVLRGEPIVTRPLHLVDHVDAQRAEDVGAQGRAAAVHAKNDDDGPPQCRARQHRDRSGARRRTRQCRGCGHAVIHWQCSICLAPRGLAHAGADSYRAKPPG